MMLTLRYTIFAYQRDFPDMNCTYVQICKRFALLN